ncbi:MAG: glycosyltransferase [Planctomycetes bacterium]|nr:glycosyltransferase [Planctomycetota bacterium]
MSPLERPLSILALSPFLPYPPDHGGRIRTFLLLRELARRGHRVALVALVESEAELARAAELAAHGLTVQPVLHLRRFGSLTLADRVRKATNLLRGRSDVLARFASPAALRVARHAMRGPWDVVLAELLWTAPLALRLDARLRVLDAHNVETVIARRTAENTTGVLARAAARLEARGLRRDETRLVSRFEAVVVVSDADRERLAERVPGAACTVIGNCVDTDVLLPLAPAPAAAPVCLFVGSPTYPPNARAVEFFGREIFPEVRRRFSGARFVAVGADPAARLSRLAREVPGIAIPGYLEDIVTAYREATVVVVPIAVGGGTRTKILEAMALGRPVVSTTVGAEGLPITPGEHALVADEPGVFAAAIAVVHEDRERARKLVDAGRRLVEAHGSARAAGAALEALLRASLERKAIR